MFSVSYIQCSNPWTCRMLVFLIISICKMTYIWGSYNLFGKHDNIILALASSCQFVSYVVRLTCFHICVLARDCLKCWDQFWRLTDNLVLLVHFLLVLDHKLLFANINRWSQITIVLWKWFNATSGVLTSASVCPCNDLLCCDGGFFCLVHPRGPWVCWNVD